MLASKVILLTGASRGIGLAVARRLLQESHKLCLVARSSGPLEKLKNEFPGQVEYIAADLSDFSLVFSYRSKWKSLEVGSLWPFFYGIRNVGPKAVGLAVKAFSRIDGVVINHGTLTPVRRISESTPEEWRSAFDVNFFSAISFIKPALPFLRKTGGRIVLTSSGAATASYSTWGAYGSSKAALNHLAMTLAVEEPDIITVAIRPGVVDTEMQSVVRAHNHVMDAKDAEKFKSLHEEGRLLRPEQPGSVMAQLVLDGGKDLSGKFLSWDDKVLDGYRDVE